MRCMCRNERTVYYRKYAGLTDIVNEDGYYTGEQEASYEDAKAIKGVISPPAGAEYRDMIGASPPTHKMSTSSNVVHRR